MDECDRPQQQSIDVFRVELDVLDGRVIVGQDVDGLLSVTTER